MELRKLSPILWTKQMDASIAFYTGVLGFSCLARYPNFASLLRENVEIMLVEPVEEPAECADSAEETEPFFASPKFTGSFYITMIGVDKLWNSIKEKVAIESAINDREYGMRDFSILDNNGYEIVFGEPIQKDK